MTTRQVMQSGGFVQRVVAAADDLPMDGGDQHFAGSFFKHVSPVHGCDRLRPQGVRARAVLNEQWVVVAAVENDLSVLGEQFGRLVGYLTATDGTFSLYQVTGIGLISLETNRVVVLDELPTRLAEIVTKYRRHTIANFVVATLQHPGSSSSTPCCRSPSSRSTEAPLKRENSLGTS
jgi:hypothetical protein